MVKFLYISFSPTVAESYALQPQGLWRMEVKGHHVTLLTCDFQRKVAHVVLQLIWDWLRPLMIKSVSQCFGGVSIVCICSVCVVCVFVWNEAKCLWTFTIDVLITVGWKTVTGEKRDIGYSHFICFRGGEKKICFLSAYLFILLIKHFKIVCLSENYISYFESYYLSYTNNIRMQVKATAETNSYPDADYPSSLLHCQGRDAFADCVFFFFLVKDHLLCKIFPPVAWKYPKKRYAK